MSANDVLTVHHTTKTPDGDLRITRITPYLRLASGSHVLFAKLGKIMDENGVVVEDIPQWVEEALSATAPKVLAEIGFQDRVQNSDASRKRR